MFALAIIYYWKPALLEEGSANFSATWKKIFAKREPEEFKNAQHGFIKRTHYDVVLSSIKRQFRLNINDRSSVLQDVIWSAAVQHGPWNIIVQVAPESQDVNNLSEVAIIKLIYTERGRVTANGTLLHFTNNSKTTGRGEREV